MSSIPLERYPGLPPLFLDFARGRSRFHPDPPTIDAAVVRGKELLARREPPRIPASAFRFRATGGGQAAEDLAGGRAVAVIAGHQIGLFTGPLFTVVKAFDAIAIARELSRRGVPAVAVFWALTDDHDLEEIARTAKPGPDGPQRLVLEGADRSNRSPVGSLPIPEGVREIVDAFRADARDEEAMEIVDAFARRYAPGRPYGEAFIESLFDLTADEPLLVVDPQDPDVSEAARRFFLLGVERNDQVRETLRLTAEEIERSGREPSVAFRPDLFPFFTIEGGARRRVNAEDLDAAAKRVESGEARVSADVLTRPVLKSLVLPAAVSLLGPSEIAYHAQALPLFRVFGVPAPVLVARTLMVLRGPAERRAQRSLGIAEEDLLTPGAAKGRATPVPQADRLHEIARRLESELSSLGPDVEELDPTLAGALETTRRKATYQLEQLGERMRKAAERKDEVAWNRRKRLETMALPGGEPAERVYPPLVFLLAWGRGVLDVIRAAAGRGSGEIALLDVEAAAGAEAKKIHAG
jgi:bacillithiol biosynthesis cysteine-adding enzyme BshC